MGCPDLRSVEDIVVTVRRCAQLQRGKVRPRAGFGKALAPIILARQDARQIVCALLGGAVMHDHRRHHLQSHRREVRRTGARAFGGENITLDLVPSGSAELGRPVGRGPAFCMEDLLPWQRDRRVVKKRSSRARRHGASRREAGFRGRREPLRENCSGPGRSACPWRRFVRRPRAGPSWHLHQAARAPTKPSPAAIWIDCARPVAPSFADALRR